MAKDFPQNKEEHIESALALIGSPVIRINATPDQMRLAVRLSLEKFVDYHYQSTEYAWVSHKIDQDLKDTKRFKVPDEVLQVTFVHGIDFAAYRHGFLISSGGAHHDVNSGHSLNTFNDYHLDSVSIFLSQRSLSYFNQIQNAPEVFRFNQITKEVQVDIDEKDLNIDDYILYKAQINLMDTHSSFWANEWFLRYTAAQIKKMWGNNLSKFAEVQLPGGHTINGEGILSNAKEEITELEEELYDNLSFFETGMAIG